MIVILIVAIILLAFATGVAESNRILAAIHAGEASVHQKLDAAHARLTALEEAIKGKL